MDLHSPADEKVFDSVIVITDRVVLDKQLQDTIYQFEHKTGVVEKIDEDTRQLARALSGGTPIVINGRIVGAIGVSGGTSEQDGEVAAAYLIGLE